MCKPKRIQRKRIKGWKKPPNTINIARPSKFGNPHNWQGGLEYGYSKRDCKELAKTFFIDSLNKNELPFTREDIKRELKGKNLMCWCKEGEPCHGDVLLMIANA